MPGGPGPKPRAHQPHLSTPQRDTKKPAWGQLSCVHFVPGLLPRRLNNLAPGTEGRKGHAKPGLLHGSTRDALSRLWSVQFPSLRRSDFSSSRRFPNMMLSLHVALTSEFSTRGGHTFSVPWRLAQGQAQWGLMIGRSGPASSAFSMAYAVCPPSAGQAL